jgi:hypothetical protein
VAVSSSMVMPDALPPSFAFESFTVKFSVTSFHVSPMIGMEIFLDTSPVSNVSVPFCAR